MSARIQGHSVIASLDAETHTARRADSFAFEERVIGASRWAIAAPAMVAAHAAHARPVLIEGEPGSGKDFLARLIHQNSPHGGGPFLAVCCESLGREAIEDMLYGQRPAAGSVLVGARGGLVEAGRGGTLYIQQASLPAEAFLSLLSPLLSRAQAEESWRSGPNVRVIVGLTEPLGDPRFDTLRIPPLRERRADIEPLARHFLESACRRQAREARDLAPDAIDALVSYDWPGNLSELRRVVEMMLQRARPPMLDASILPRHLGAHAAVREAGPLDSSVDLTAEVRQYERSLLCAALSQCHGVQTSAAKLLGLKVTTLNAKIAAHGIEVAEFKERR